MTNISVIIPVYRTERFLKMALDSINAMSEDNIEIVVVDDASNGNCSDIVNEYKNTKKSIKYIQHTQNRGSFFSRCYTGVLNATGEYVTFLDPDDWVVNDIYTKAYNKAKIENLDIVMFNVLQQDENGYQWIEEENFFLKDQLLNNDEVIYQILNGRTNAWIWSITCNQLVKRDLATNIFHYFEDEKFHLNMYDDLLWNIMLFSSNKAMKISTYTELGLVYYKHSQSITKNNNFISYYKKYNDVIFVLKRIKHILTKLDMYSRYKSLYTKLVLHFMELFTPLNKRPSNNKFFLKWCYIVLKHIVFNIPYMKYNYLRDVAVHDIVESVKSNNIQAISIFGTNDFAIMLNKTLNDNRINVDYYITSDIVKAGDKIDNIKIIHIGNVNSKMPICIASISSYNAIIALLKHHGIDTQFITISNTLNNKV